MNWTPIAEGPPPTDWYLVWMVHRRRGGSGYTWEPALFSGGEWQFPNDEFKQYRPEDITHYMKIEKPTP